MKRQIITGSQFRLRFQQFDELDNRMRAFRLVAMNARENANANRRVAALRPDKQIARQFVSFAARVKFRLVIGHEIRRMDGDLIQRREQRGDGAALFARRLRRIFCQ